MSKKTKEEFDEDKPKPKQTLTFTGDIAAIMAAPDLKVPDSHVVRPQDIKAGMYITISKWYDAKDAPLGLPMEVLSVALPFLACRSVTDVRPGALDTRDVELMVVSKDYAESFIGGKPLPKPAQQPKPQPVSAPSEAAMDSMLNAIISSIPPAASATDTTTLTAKGESLEDIMRKLIEKYKNKKKED